MRRIDFFKKLRSGNQNYAIKLHIAELEKMNEEDFQKHYENLKIKSKEFFKVVPIELL